MSDFRDSCYVKTVIVGIDPEIELPSETHVLLVEMKCFMVNVVQPLVCGELRQI